MLTQDQFNQYCRDLGLSEATRVLLSTIRSSPPVRRVRSSAENVSARYPSHKMRVIIQAESHRNELAFIHEMEYDETVLEYYDQPSQITLHYQGKKGRSVKVWHTPDFFVVRTDTAGWEECKTEKELHKLAKKMPNRYVWENEAGRWCCPPGEEYAQAYGLYYRLRSSIEIDWVFQRNILFLADYLRADCPAVSDSAAAEICQRVANEPGIKLDQLLRCSQQATSDDIYQLIASGQVYIDWRTAPLAEPDRVRLFVDQWTAQAFVVIPETLAQTDVDGFQQAALEVNASVHWDGQPWTIINVGETEIWLRSLQRQIVKLSPAEFDTLQQQGALVGSKEPLQADVSAEARELLTRASPQDLQVANQRYQIISPILAGQSANGRQVPRRTLYDWVKKYHQAQRLHRCGFVGLLPQLYRSGNRRRRLPEETWSVIEEFIDTNYETFKQKFKYEVYGELLLSCERRGVQAPSYKTFAEAINKRAGYEQTCKREGVRRAYAQEPFHWELELTTPRHGDRPFEIGHLDHTQLDIELVHSVTGHNLGRPWATFLTDACSRRLLSVYLSFEPPSYRSCMMALRECVRRHQRLPQCLVVDGGAEFKSTYFETLMARYECTQKTRPPAKSRFGSVCERLFGSANTRFVYNLVGNTQIMRHVRQVTKTVDPKQHAQWSLADLYHRLRQWAYEVYDTIEHPALGQSPREAFVRGLQQGGQRRHRIIPYDEEFYRNTLPTTTKGTAKVDINHGVKVNYILYWTNDFRQAEVANTDVPVRYDPFDAGTIYAFVLGRWVRCSSEYYARLKGRSEQEIKLATAELRARYRRHGQQLSVTARHIAEFIESLEQEEATQAQRLSLAENKQVVTLINLGQPDQEPGAEPASDDQDKGVAEATKPDTDNLQPLTDYLI